jgi:RNA polymerase sigma factor FliA
MPSSIASAAREREQSILNQMPQVKLLAARLYRRCPANVLLEDLVSAGVTGLIEATDRYDPRRRVKLKTLAEHRIRGAMRDYLRKLDPLPRAVRSFIRDRESATGELEQRLYRAPSDDEVAAFLSIPIERYRRLSRIAQSGEMLHLDQRGEAFRSAREIPASDDWTPYTIALIRALDLAVESLPKRERTVIFLLRAGYVSSEIAQRLEVTPPFISQIKRSAITRLRIAFGVPPTNRPQTRVCKSLASERAL